MRGLSRTRRIDGTRRLLLAAVSLAGLTIMTASSFASVRHPSWQRVSQVPDADRHDAAAPVAVAVRLTEAGGATRLVFDLSSPVAVRATLTERPDRLIVDLPEVNFQVDAAAGELGNGGTGVVHAFRFGLFAPGKSRIVVDLSDPAALRRADITSIAGGDPSRLTIELVRTDRQSFAAAVRGSASERDLTKPAPSVVASPVPATNDPRPVVVIDPGHGGIDPGASGVAGVVEKSVVLDFASVLAARLSAGDRYRVVMTRQDDSFVSLEDRVRCARNANAELFISIHADTLADASVMGATVYTASDRASDAEAAHVASIENRADEAAGLEPSLKEPDVSDILFDLARRETRTYAHQFQRTLTGYWAKIARLNRNPERAAGFKVLQAPDVPSVLLELGYLSSDRDAKMLTSPEWRDKATGSVASAIDAFFADHNGAAPSQPIGAAAMR